MDIILASASERRQELLKRLLDDYKVIKSNFDEDSITFHGNCEEYVKEIAKGKTYSIAAEYNDAVIIGCDTIVCLDNHILGKPKDKQEAIDMLSLLSGKTHKVFTGISIYNSSAGKHIEASVKTEVQFSDICHNDIVKYVDSGEPMDKAGAYGIQGLGGVFVKEIHGCYYNVVGLPLNKLKSLLGEMGVNL